MRVLVTGASGLVGRYLLPMLLESGHEVTALARQPLPSAVRGKVQQLPLDLLVDAVPRQVLSVDALIHLAWITTPGVYRTSPDNALWQRASVALAKDFVAAGGRRLIVAGTCAEYRWDNSPCSEEHFELAPSTRYAQAKLATRNALHALCADGGAELLWGRIFFLYGPGESPLRLVPSVLQNMLRGEAVLCSHGRQRRDFIHAADVAAAYMYLLDTGCAAGDYNISSGSAVSIREIVELCRQATGSNSVVEYGAISVPEDDPEEILGINDKLVSTGWKPGIGIAEGIADYVEWLRGHERV